MSFYTSNEYWVLKWWFWCPFLIYMTTLFMSVPILFSSFFLHCFTLENIQGECYNNGTLNNFQCNTTYIHQLLLDSKINTYVFRIKVGTLLRPLEELFFFGSFQWLPQSKWRYLHKPGLYWNINKWTHFTVDLLNPDNYTILLKVHWKQWI